MTGTEATLIVIGSANLVATFVLAKTARDAKQAMDEIVDEAEQELNHVKTKANTAIESLRRTLRDLKV